MHLPKSLNFGEPSRLLDFLVLKGGRSGGSGGVDQAAGFPGARALFELEVLDADAVAVAARLPHLRALGEGAVHELPGEAVRPHDAPVHLDKPEPILARAGPGPALRAASDF